MKLFMFYVGGTCGGSNTELHDVRFSIAEELEGCFDDLKRQWWGDPDRVHIDCWGVVEQADGYDVEIVEDAVDCEDRLFFANLGGYESDTFAELHHNVLLVAPDTDTAKRRALALVSEWTLPHKDNLFDVENMVDVSATANTYGYRIRLSSAEHKRPFAFTPGLTRIPGAKL